MVVAEACYWVIDSPLVKPQPIIVRFSVRPDPKTVTVNTDAGPFAKPRSNLHSRTNTRYRVGFEAAYDRQNYERGQRNMMSDFGQAITIDINRFLPDGTPNPNLGRPAVVSDAFANNSYESKRESKRITAFG